MNFLDDAWQSIQNGAILDGLSGMLDWATQVLPESPSIAQYLNLGGEVKGYVNWFVPFDIAVPIFMAWLGILAATIIIRAGMKAIGLLR